MECKKLTYKNKLSVLRGGLQEWQQQNTDKDPGPPICDDVFCGTGGNIDSGSLPENDIYFFHPDHLGSTSYITNIAGETVQFNTYMPFGESFVSQKRTSTISAYLFNSKEQDPETGLYYYGARYYNPKISNWLSVDPIALYDPIDEVEHYIDGEHNGGYYNPRNMSVYGYAYQNPVLYVDPNGKQNVAGALIGAGIGSTLGAGIEYGNQVYDNYQSGMSLSAAATTNIDGRKIAGAAARGVVAGGVAGFTSGGSLIIQVSANAGGEIIGGLADRALSGEVVFDAGEVITDATAGGLGGGAASTIEKKVAKSVTLNRTTSTIVKQGVKKIAPPAARSTLKTTVNNVSETIKNNSDNSTTDSSSSNNNMQRQKANRHKTMNSGQNNS